MKLHVPSAARPLCAMSIPLLVAACATAPTMDRPNMPPQGATWTNAVKVSGSFGSGNRQTTTKMGTASWQGQSMPAFLTPALTTYTNSSGCWVAQSAGDKPLVSWDPPICYRYPIAVGNSWTDTRRLTLHQAKRTVNLESRWTVEAYEEVSVPAGEIAAFRITYSDSTGTERVDWFSPDLGLFVKSSVKRTSASPNGAGTFESELVSHTIRK